LAAIILEKAGYDVRPLKQGIAKLIDAGFAVADETDETKQMTVQEEHRPAGEAEPESAQPAEVGPLNVGDEARPWQLVEWANSDPLNVEQLRGQVVFVRFWTDNCPYCAKSLPAIAQLAEEFRDQPVTFLGLYHSKPLGTERPWQVALDQADRWGVQFPLAYDRQWKTARSWWLDGNRRVATSSSFLLNKQGRVAHIHPGPMFFPSDAPADAAHNADFEAIRTAIRTALADG
jgi:thiol-disulfide isomerase/thioredoxin